MSAYHVFPDDVKRIKKAVSEDNYARFIKIGNKEVAVKDEMKEVLSVWLGACSIPSAPGQSCKTCAYKESCKKVKEELGL